jgi:hypothetical protein
MSTKPGDIIESNDIHFEPKEYSVSVEVDKKLLDQFTSGAVRAPLSPRYDLICPCALESLAQAMAEGVPRYGADNWALGMPHSVTLNHAISHLVQEAKGDASEDHLGHALANIMMMIHFKKGCNCNEIRQNRERCITNPGGNGN